MGKVASLSGQSRKWLLSQEVDLEQKCSEYMHLKSDLGTTDRVIVQKTYH